MLHRTLLTITISLFVVPVAAQAPVCADSNSDRNCCGVTQIDECPVRGCGGDAPLNRRKNIRSKPTAAEVEDLTILELANFKSPAEWESGRTRTLLKSWGEGRAVRIKGYLIKAENYTDGAESTNCYLRRNDYNDFHLVIVSNPTAAKRAAAKMESDSAATREAGKKAFKRAEKKSMTAEITPRLRDEGWTIEKLRALARDFTYVRITGWALLDTQHIDRPINRLSNWEIHPVTKFEACTGTVSECDSDENWEDLENFEP